MNIKKHLVFGWGPHTHDELGGWSHYLGEGNNAAEGIALLYEAIADAEHSSGAITNGHVVDLETKEIVYRWSKP